MVASSGLPGCGFGFIISAAALVAPPWWFLIIHRRRGLAPLFLIPLHKLNLQFKLLDQFFILTKVQIVFLRTLLDKGQLLLERTSGLESDFFHFFVDEIVDLLTEVSELCFHDIKFLDHWETVLVGHFDGLNDMRLHVFKADEVTVFGPNGIHIKVLHRELAATVVISGPMIPRARHVVHTNTRDAMVQNIHYLLCMLILLPWRLQAQFILDLLSYGSFGRMENIFV